MPAWLSHAQPRPVHAWLPVAEVHAVGVPVQLSVCTQPVALLQSAFDNESHAVAVPIHTCAAPPAPPMLEPPFGEPPFDEPPFDEPPFDEPPLDEPPFDEPPVGDPPLLAPADAPPVDDPP